MPRLDIGQQVSGSAATAGREAHCRGNSYDSRRNSLADDASAAPVATASLASS
ncbi:hypothetical protein [Corynebacterium sp. HMSC064E07]|uniref:hypothetical protein n=1 Tax=Corynebacterium sp. HMSC064E07 TaxID=1739545 RepID=UPI001FED9CB9|nr:hypothetical protein [Corynebacterium sp. HMSC064E07]